jgi:ubiquitin C-terminal hydrolase
MPLLRAYLLSGQYKATGDLNKDNPLGTGGKLLEEFAELLRVMWSGKYGERSPTRFRALLGKARAQFSAADQQDAQVSAS